MADSARKRRKGAATSRVVVAAIAAVAVLAIGALFLATGGLNGSSGAAGGTGPIKVSELKPAEVAEAAAAVKAAGVKCRVTQGYRLRYRTYEVACADNLGQMVVMRDQTYANAYDCLTVAAKVASQEPNWPFVGATCRLPDNADQAPKLAARMAAAGSACAPVKARVMPSADPGFFAEVACRDGASMVLEERGGRYPPTTHSCIDYLGGANACTLTAKPQMLSWVESVAVRAGRACKVTDARYLAYRSTGEAYYELACQGGFVLETKPDGAAAKAIACSDAHGLGDGCKFDS